MKKTDVPSDGDTLTVYVSHDPQIAGFLGGWRAQTPGRGTGYSHGSPWSVVAEAIGNWIRMGKPESGGRVYAPVPANAIGSEAVIAREVYAEHHYKLRTAKWWQFARMWCGIGKIIAARQAVAQ